MPTPDFQPLRIVAFSANIHRPSRSYALSEMIAGRIAARTGGELTHYDILDAGPGLGAALIRDQLTPEALKVIEAIETCDVLVVTTPVYKGSYTGLFKHLFDFVGVNALTNKPVVLSATGGGQRHALVVEHQLRPLFGFFSALTIPTAVYAEDGSFEHYQQTDPGILARIDMAVSQCAALVQRSRPPALGGKVVSLKA